MKKISIAEDYSQFPAGRHSKDGEGNGEDFRIQHLVPILENNEKAIILLDGVYSYPPSFLEEAFGGLVRVNNFSASQIIEAFEFRTELPYMQKYIKKIHNYIENAEKMK